MALQSKSIRSFLFSIFFLLGAFFLASTSGLYAGFTDWLPWSKHAQKSSTKQTHVPSYCYALKRSFAEEQIDLGRQYAKNIMEHGVGSVPQATRTELLSTLVALTWYFCAGHDNTAERARNFKEGAFLIPRDFFPLVEKYLKFVQSEGYSIEGWYRGPNPFAYYRTSSHLKKITKNRHIGIDICFDKRHGTQALLPGRKRHLLFIDYGDKDFIYMKPENYGIYGIVDACFHGAEFIIEKVGRIRPIRALFRMKHDDHPIYNKEQIPTDVKNAYQKLLKTCQVNKKSHYHRAAKENIAEIYSHTKMLKSEHPDKAAQIDQFATQLEKRFNHLETRIGNEVILSKTDILEYSFI